MPNPDSTMPNPAQLAAISLVHLDHPLAVGDSVVCFQPPERWDRHDYLFCRSRILNNPIERGPGWWKGQVVAIEPGNEGQGSWYIVQDRRSGKKWDYDGKDFPLYPCNFDSLPEVIKAIFQASPPLGVLVGIAREVPPEARSGPRVRPGRPNAGNLPPTPPATNGAGHSGNDGVPSLEDEFFRRPNTTPPTGPTGPQG